MYMDKIDALSDAFKEAENDRHKTLKVMDKAEALFSRIKGERSKKSGEMTNGNIMFKALRRLGYLKKLSKIIAKAYDTASSLS